MLNTLRTLFRASRAETEDALIEANAIPLLAQHLRDAKIDVQRARQGLAALVARKAAEERQSVALNEEIARREEDARAAMDAGEEPLLHEIADRIAGLEDRRAQAGKAKDELQQRISALRETLSDAERRMGGLTDELRLAQGQSMHRKATGALDTGVPDSSLRKAEETARRLRVAGTRADDTAAALADMRPDADLDTRLREAGIDSQTNQRRGAILERLKSNQGETK